MPTSTTSLREFSAVGKLERREPLGNRWVSAARQNSRGGGLSATATRNDIAFAVRQYLHGGQGIELALRGLDCAQHVALRHDPTSRQRLTRRSFVTRQPQAPRRSPPEVDRLHHRVELPAYRERRCRSASPSQTTGRLRILPCGETPTIPERLTTFQLADSENSRSDVVEWASGSLS